MKRLTIYFAAILFTAFAFAGGDREKKAEKTSQIKLQEVKNNVYQLIYPFENEQQVTIEIYNQEGQQLNKENIKNHDGFARMYDMSGLKEGRYTFKVKDAEGEINKALDLKQENQIAVIDRKGGKYQLLVDFSSRSDLYLNIYDEDNKLVHHEKYENSKGFTRTFDFAKLKGKEYKFEVRGYSDIISASTVK